MSTLRHHTIEPWAAYPASAPILEQRGNTLIAVANQTPHCNGGWHITYNTIRGGATYDLMVGVEYEGSEPPRDVLQCMATWEALPVSKKPTHAAKWFFLLPEEAADGGIVFRRTAAAPMEAQALTIRYAFKWSKRGRTEWSFPLVEEMASTPPRVVRASVVTGSEDRLARHSLKTVHDHVAFYLELCIAACGADQPELMVLPEWALQWQAVESGGCSPIDLAVLVPGAETDVFADLARKHHVHIVLPVIERTHEGAIHNSAILIGPDRIVGTYHKMHLALNEGEQGILPGNSMPVFRTPIGMIGCNICMDSSALESSRLAALAGAEILALPIMGDFRADRWTAGKPIFDEDRWRAIMRTRAMDNAMHLVVARNTVPGSCIVDPTGTILAWNDGSRDHVTAELRLDEEHCMWNGCVARDALWIQRRPHLYGRFTEPLNFGQILNRRDQPHPGPGSNPGDA